MPFRIPHLKVGTITVTSGAWCCGYCQDKTAIEARAIWEHLAQCEVTHPKLREEARFLYWYNCDADQLKFARFRRLILELTFCTAHDRGCWWCRGPAPLGNHPVEGQFLMAAARLAKFTVPA